MSLNHVTDLKPDVVPPKRFTPVGNQVAVHVHKPLQYGELVLPDDAASHYQSPRGTVIAVGEAVKFVKEGDVVMFHPHTMCPDIYCLGDKYVMIKEETLLGIVLPEFREKVLKGK